MRVLCVPSGLIASIGAMALIAPGNSWADSLGGASSGHIDGVRVLAALALCLVLAVAAALVLRQRSGAGPVLTWPLVGWPRGAATPKRVTVLERTRLTAQLEVCLLRWDDREVLVGATPTGGFVVLGPVGETTP